MTEPKVTDGTAAPKSNPSQTPALAGQPPQRLAKKWGGLRRPLIVFAVVAGAYLGWRGLSKHAGTSPGSARTQVVAVEKATREDLAQTLTMTGEFRPFQQAALHAKIAGFLQSISVDVGDHVSEGQAIAQLDVPELKSELEKALAAHRASEQEVVRAEANYNEAHLASRRLQGVVKQNPKLVAGQELDAVLAKEQSAAGALDAVKQRVEESQAEVNKVRSMLAYTTITAPFDGVITKRYVDTGALVPAGTASNAQPVVDIAEHKRLRLTFPVPESAVALVKANAPVDIAIESLGRTLHGKVSRFSGKVDRATRTMSTEADIENADGKLRPGLYAAVSLTLRESKGATVVSAQGVGSGEMPTVLVVTSNGVVEERKVSIGLRTAAKAEILSGLSPGEMVIVGSRAGIQPGQKVTAKPIETKSAD